MKVSVVVPSKGCKYLNYLLLSLRRQTIKPYEIILIVKDYDTKYVEGLCSSYGLSCIVIEQNKGFFTTALNIGKRVAKGDVVLFTDDDAIAPRRWVERYVKAFSRASKNVAGISSRDVYIKLDTYKIFPTKDDHPLTKLYRWFIRTWLEQPLEVLRDYRFGVYINKDLMVVHGPYLPSRSCLSLPYRGVNMGFRGEVMDVVEFPEDPKLRRAPGNEQYAGLKLVLNGFKTIYIPNNPILHVYREESLSRTKDKNLRKEAELMRSLYLELLSRSSQWKAN